jgi:hypothetical protein
MPSVSAESSLLMWALSALIMWMAAHVLLGWMRQAQEEWEWDLARLLQVGVGGFTFGTAVSVAIPLGLAGEAISFPVGYHMLMALALWLGTVVLVTLLALVPVWREETASATGAGVLLGLLITGLQVAWITAVGFRPGVQWDPVFIGAAALLSSCGLGTAMSIAFPYGDRARGYRYSWRIAAAGLMGLSFLAGYALLLVATDLPTQIGSVYRHDLPGSAISLLGGGLMPLLLALMVYDLEARRRARRRSLRNRRHGSNSVFAGESVMPSMDLQPAMYRPHDHHRSSYAAPPVAQAAAAASPPAAPASDAALTTSPVSSESAEAASSATAVEPADPHPPATAGGTR